MVSVSGVAGRSRRCDEIFDADDAEQPPNDAARVVQHTRLPASIEPFAALLEQSRACTVDEGDVGEIDMDLFAFVQQLEATGSHERCCMGVEFPIESNETNASAIIAADA